jgi:hypothetical protein
MEIESELREAIGSDAMRVDHIISTSGSRDPSLSGIGSAVTSELVGGLEASCRLRYSIA